MANQITPNPSVPSQVVAEVKFPKFINNLGIIPTSYKDSMSYYECLAWLCKFLEEQVIPTVNENGEAVEELQNLYVELNEYVTNYFDNLDVQEEINNKLDKLVEDGTLSSIIAEYFNSYVTPEMFGAIGDGTTDDTSAFISAIENINDGGILMLKPNKNYLISDTIELPLNVSIQGMQTFNDISSKLDGFSDSDLTKGMSTISMIGNARFLLNGNNDIEKIVIAYPEQNYDIKNVSKSIANPDGLTNFVQYYPTFTMIGKNIGVVIKDIIYLGGYDFFYSDETRNPEKLFIDRVVGMCVGTFVKILNCKDMMNFSNIIMNANSLKPYINKVQGSDINFYTKCAKNTVLFSFGGNVNSTDYGCDGSQINNCFAYGIKRFIEMNGEGNSPMISQCGCDMCHEFLFINSHVKPFGTYLNNITVTPLVYKAIIDDIETTNSPSVIRINSGISDHIIHVTNLTVFGNASSLITDSNKCNYVFSISNTSQNTRIDVVNAKLIANYLQDNFNTIGNNNISQSAPNSYRILTLTNVTLNGNDIDSNINKSRTIYVKRTAGEGQQIISGIGFKPSNILIRSCLGLSHKYSIGTSDGVLSKSISQTESGVQITSGGNSIIQQWCTDSSNRYDGNLQSINNDGFVINWVASGSNLPEGNFEMIITCTR